MRGLLVSLVVLSACAPSQRRLLAGRNYPEALAGVEQGALDGGAVLSQLASDLAPGLHLQALSAAELRGRVAGPGPGLDEVALVRAIHDSNAVTLADYALTISLLQGGAPALVDTSLAALARRTGEALPEAKLVHHPDASRYALVQRTRFPLLELFGRLTVNLLTLGVVHSAVPIVENKGTPAYTERIEPGAADYERASPGAAALRAWLATPECSGLGARCEQWLLWPRAGAGRTLVVVVRLGLLHPAALIYQVPLADGPLEEALRGRFGERVQTLDELARAAGVRPQVSYPLRVEFDEKTKQVTAGSRAQICRAYKGKRRRPGLAGRPGLAFVIEVGVRGGASNYQITALRAALLGCGVPPERIELTEDDGYDAELRVRHELVAGPM